MTRKTVMMNASQHQQLLHLVKTKQTTNRNNHNSNTNPHSLNNSGSNLATTDHASVPITSNISIIPNMQQHNKAKSNMNSPQPSFHTDMESSG